MGQNVMQLRSKADRQAARKAVTDIAQDTMREAGLPAALMDAVLRDPEAIAMIVRGQ